MNRAQCTTIIDTYVQNKLINWTHCTTVRDTKLITWTIALIDTFVQNKLTTMDILLYYSFDTDKSDYLDIMY